MRVRVQKLDVLGWKKSYMVGIYPISVIVVLRFLGHGPHEKSIHHPSKICIHNLCGCCHLWAISILVPTASLPWPFFVLWYETNLLYLDPLPFSSFSSSSSSSDIDQVWYGGSIPIDNGKQYPTGSSKLTLSTAVNPKRTNWSVWMEKSILGER